jgi:hypothetical protein
MSTVYTELHSEKLTIRIVMGAHNTYCEVLRSHLHMKCAHITLTLVFNVMMAV